MFREHSGNSQPTKMVKHFKILIILERFENPDVFGNSLNPSTISSHFLFRAHSGNSQPIKMLEHLQILSISQAVKTSQCFGNSRKLNIFSFQILFPEHSANSFKLKVISQTVIVFAIQNHPVHPQSRAFCVSQRSYPRHPIDALES